jgi:hypothetical protein
MRKRHLTAESQSSEQALWYYDHPHVCHAVLKVVDFWLGLGVDGLRLDAVPYLFEREGTTGENLPETHAALRRSRRHIDQHYQHRMLLAEANQWPEDAAAYFGEGDECHMVFHFPLMPRLFLALRMEDRLPILDILEQTPPTPATAQWAVFLRNHDELTLEMVSAAVPLCAPILRQQAPGPFSHLHVKTSWSYSRISCWQLWQPTSERRSIHDLPRPGSLSSACANSWKRSVSVGEHACTDLGKIEPGSIMCRRGGVA